jgi:membrane-bound lytic murein transglycosylase A
VARPGFGAPVYRPPPAAGQRKPWYTRQEMDTLPEARAQLAGHELAWLADPVDALILQIQGSGRVRVTEADGSQRLVRLAFAATNDQPYRSPGRWLIDQGLLRGDVTWPGIKRLAGGQPAAPAGAFCGATRAWCSSARSRCRRWTRSSARAARRAWR